MRNLIYFFLAFALLFSCSESDEDEMLLRKPVSVTLMVKQNAGSVFESIDFKLGVDKAVTLLQLINSYDSLVWIVPDLGRFNLLDTSFKNDSYANHFVFSWAHVFVHPKSYVTILKGYKDNQVILSDSVEVDIENGKDFLVFNWKDVTESSGNLIGYQNVFMNDSEWFTRCSVESGKQSIELFLINTLEEDEKEFSKNSLRKMFELASELYLKPYYSREKDPSSLLAEYNELFINKTDDNLSPLYIWLTPKSKIVLLEYKDTLLKEPQYKLHAEPNS